VDESALDNDDVFGSSRKPLPPSPPTSSSSSSTSRGGVGSSSHRFSPHSVQCSLETAGFFNQQDPFWQQSVHLPDRSPAASDADVSPLLQVTYKNSDNVSYEDLLDFSLDR
jgi:hypothetical protein